MIPGLLPRLSLGLTLGSFALILLAYSHHPAIKGVFCLCVCVVIALCTREYIALLEKKGIYPKRGVLYAFNPLLILLFTLTQHTPLFSVCLSLLFYAVLVLPFLLSFSKIEEPITTLATTYLGIFYLITPLSTLILINYYFSRAHTLAGPLFLLYLVLVTKLGDVGAYFVGKMVGRFSLAPVVSPKKTIEGALGGLLVSICTSLFFYAYTPIGLTFPEALFLGMSLGILAQIGDLSASVLKRDAGVKDSSNIPGLGGVIDMIDSLLFSAPFAYMYLLYKWPL